MVSRPNGVGFLDHRADGIAVLDSLDAIGEDCFEMEFLRPATSRNLVLRLKDKTLPQVDILHFDGHGSFDRSTGVGSLCFSQIEAGQLNYSPIEAEWLGSKLAAAGISLVVLSACQSAQVGGELAIGNVAITLLRAGVGAVLAMTYSVLVETTRRLFSNFYGDLARGATISAALDSARLDLRQHSWRGRRRWNTESFELCLQDWFLPALYQSSVDHALLLLRESLPSIWDKLSLPTKADDILSPLTGSRFYGRSRELWALEKSFMLGARRASVFGLSGQGKTALAKELGRWLVRSHMFKQVRFVSYDGFSGGDPVEYALSSIFRSL